jgi:predicted Zn-dependent protease with MMP-like domain
VPAASSGASRYPAAMAIDISDEAFEDWVFEAIDELPEQFRSQLASVAFIILDEPTPEELDRLRTHGMYAYYDGVHRSMVGADSSPIPSKITIFKGPCVRAFDDEARVHELVRRTVQHEIGHHWGMHHDRIERMWSEPIG